MKRTIVFLVFISLFLIAFSIDVPSSYSQNTLPTSAPGSLVNNESYIRSDRLGITFISSVDNHNSADRYRNALILGAGWNRWPMYWDRVETEMGQFNWTAYDALVKDDLANGLRINAILLGVPSFYRDGNRPTGINEPIYADGSDRSGGTLNANNPWANYVRQAVRRYKPGGQLAKTMGWGNNAGVRVWEIWNEPDHAPFWQGSINDYARLLKTAYIVIKEEDPDAMVMFGGLLFSTEDNWLARVLALYQTNDAFAADSNYYFDAVAIHSYDYPWRSGWLTLWAKETLRAYELNKPVWLNESGVSVWDDYPGPVWADKVSRARRATAEQQAWYFIQSTAYAWSEGADKVFFHQLYDDCGNQPAGTDFPPHNGELCTDGAMCTGDAFGIYRNAPGSVCFSQHPFGGTPRPIARAYRLMADIFGREPFRRGEREQVEGAAQMMTFYRINTEERIIVLWNRTFEPFTVEIEATSNSARLYTLDGEYSIQTRADGIHSIELEPAIPDYFPDLQAGDLTAIGGPPVILVEHVTQEVIDSEAFELTIEPASGTPTGPANLEIGPLVPPPARPTVDPALDDVPPITSVDPLPDVTGATFRVVWRGEDNSGIDRYIVWVRMNGGEWQPWLETSRTEADYTGVSGNTYEFAVWAVDLAGNWSANTTLLPQATTRVQ